MSIHIDMEPYCDGCPEMDPEVENTDYYGDMRKNWQRICDCM